MGDITLRLSVNRRLTVDDGIWSIHFCHVLLGRVDERHYIIRAQPPVTHVAGLFCYPSSRLLTISTTLLLPRLHREQSVCRFAKAVAPPWDQATM
jgi:hypothetical protein